MSFFGRLLGITDSKDRPLGVNYVTHDGATFLLNPEELGSRNPHNYRGHNWRLINLDGTPTSHKLSFHHVDQDGYRLRRELLGNSRRRDQSNDWWLSHPWRDGQAEESTGQLRDQLVDRDQHYYSIGRDDRPALPLPAYLEQEIRQSPAADPVQREAMPPDTTPRSRLITKEEGKLAARVESAAHKR